MTTPPITATWTMVEDAVRGYLHRRLQGDASTADDLSQEVFLRLHQHLPNLRSPEAAGAMTMRIARSVLVDHLRRRRRMEPLGDLESTAANHSTDHATSCVLHALRQHLDTLADHELAALRLVDLEGRPPAEAAKDLGIGLSALKARLHRGRHHLRTRVDRSCAITRDGRGHPTDCAPREGHCATAACPEVDHELV